MHSGTSDMSRCPESALPNRHSSWKFPSAPMRIRWTCCSMTVRAGCVRRASSSFSAMTGRKASRLHRWRALSRISSERAIQNCQASTRWCGWTASEAHAKPFTSEAPRPCGSPATWEASGGWLLRSAGWFQGRGATPRMPSSPITATVSHVVVGSVWFRRRMSGGRKGDIFNFIVAYPGAARSRLGKTTSAQPAANAVAAARTARSRHGVTPSRIVRACR